MNWAFKNEGGNLNTLGEMPVEDGKKPLLFQRLIENGISIMSSQYKDKSLGDIVVEGSANKYLNFD